LAIRLLTTPARSRSSSMTVMAAISAVESRASVLLSSVLITSTPSTTAIVSMGTTTPTTKNSRSRLRKLGIRSDRKLMVPRQTSCQLQSQLPRRGSETLPDATDSGL
jgi:hypothetical protein